MRQTLSRRLNVRLLASSGDRIALFTLPFLVVGVVLNVMYPAVFGRRRPAGRAALGVGPRPGRGRDDLGLVGGPGRGEGTPRRAHHHVGRSRS